MNTRIVIACIFVTFPTLLVHGQALERGAYLQNGSPTEITVRWRTKSPADSVVRFGRVADKLDLTASKPGKRTEHAVRLTGLAPDTEYFYSIGTTNGPIAGNASYHFLTAPASAKPTRIWVLGDPGTGNNDQRRVRDAYYAFTGSRHTDLWLMLGDNAYDSGKDDEYTRKLFDIYPTMLRKSVLWATLGNHDAKSSSSPDGQGPYYSQFTFPENGGAGGVASGTEAYYSFDYGNIHFVCLDSAGSDLSANGAMAKWVTHDLQDNIKDWTIVFFHHPPYSKGSHNSDSESNLVAMRENFNPILEAYGADLVLCGHSHSYERSKFINGHYGNSDTFKKSMVQQPGSGKDAGAYTKTAAGPVPREGTVYTVAGSSGQSDGGSLDHPAMWISLKTLGSLVLDIDGNRLTSTFLDDGGKKRDTFSIIKGRIENPQPTVRITRPTDGAAFTAPATFAIQADAAETGGTITKVDFYRGKVLLGTDSSAPYRHVWKNVPAGTWNLKAVATDDHGATATSRMVKIRVKSR